MLPSIQLRKFKILIKEWEGWLNEWIRAGIGRSKISKSFAHFLYSIAKISLLVGMASL